MPPNLGGFFMVRSYYPSECHADYCDFERIGALKPAIEACGSSTLPPSPLLGCHERAAKRGQPSGAPRSVLMLRVGVVAGALDRRDRRAADAAADGRVA